MRGCRRRTPVEVPFAVGPLRKTVIQHCVVASTSARRGVQYSLHRLVSCVVIAMASRTPMFIGLGETAGCAVSCCERGHIIS